MKNPRSSATGQPILRHLAAASAAIAAVLTLAAPTQAAGLKNAEGDFRPIAAAEWNYDMAAHLLERAGFGGAPDEVEALARMGPTAAVRHLVRYQGVEDVALPAFRETGIYPAADWSPVNTRKAFAAVLFGTADKLPAPQRAVLMDAGRTGVTPEVQRVAMTDKQAVVDAFYYWSAVDGLEMRRAETWLVDRALKTRRPLQEKLTLFWHGHFATSNGKVHDYRKMLGQFAMLRGHANGNLRDLLVGIGKDPAMLVYLDNLQNVKGHPNENFAREIFELFALGVGAYTETDIKEAARAFTGWTLDANGTGFVDAAALHDDGVKTVLGRTGNLRGEDVVDIILEQEATSRFIGAKLYRYFVREDLSEARREEVGAMLREANYEIAPFLKRLFLSRDFYSEAAYATQIKSPVQLVLSTYKKLGITAAPTYPEFPGLTASLGQEVFYPPSVKGWDGGRAWINPATVFQRQNIARYVLFPEEMPRKEYAHLEGSRMLAGDFVHDQFMDWAKKGDFRSFPKGGEMKAGGGSMMETGMLSKEDFNLFRGVFSAGWRARAAVPPEARKTAPVALVELVRGEGLTETGAVVDHFVKRFLRSPITGKRRDNLVAFLDAGVGGQRLDLAQPGLEAKLRELVHLILSSPEYQLA